MTGPLAPEHVWALLAIALAAAALVVLARQRPGAWLKVLAVGLIADEVTWWAYLALGGGEPGQRAQPLPLQLCDVAILVAAAALWTPQTAAGRGDLLLGAGGNGTGALHA